MVVMTCRLSPETAHFVDMLAQRDQDSPRRDAAADR